MNYVEDVFVYYVIADPKADAIVLKLQVIYSTVRS